MGALAGGGGAHSDGGGRGSASRLNGAGASASAATAPPLEAAAAPGAPPPRVSSASAASRRGRNGWRPDRLHAALVAVLLLVASTQLLLSGSLPRDAAPGAASGGEGAAGASGAGAAGWAAAGGGGGAGGAALSRALHLAAARGGSSANAAPLAAQPQAPAPGPLLTYLPDSGATTLVLYAFADTDGEARANFEHFVRAAIIEGNAALAAGAAGARVDYLLLLQDDRRARAAADGYALPALPPNARYVWHENVSDSRGAREGGGRGEGRAEEGL